MAKIVIVFDDERIDVDLETESDEYLHAILDQIQDEIADIDEMLAAYPGEDDAELHAARTERTQYNVSKDAIIKVLAHRRKERTLQRTLEMQAANNAAKNERLRHAAERDRDINRLFTRVAHRHLPKEQFEALWNEAKALYAQATAEVINQEPEPASKAS